MLSEGKNLKGLREIQGPVFRGTTSYLKSNFDGKSSGRANSRG